MNTLKYALVILPSMLYLMGSIQAMKSEPSMLSKLYCLVLGNDDASAIYQEKAYQALASMGVEDPSSVPVKKMNSVGPCFAQEELSTFTALGIWLNADYLESLSEEERGFLIYHEAAHYAQNHHPKLIAGCGLGLLLTTVGLAALKNALQSCDTFTQYGALISVSALIGLASYYYVLPYFVKQQEKDADIQAAKTLRMNGKNNVIQAHIKNLEALKEISLDGQWWLPLHEQIEYLKKEA